MARAVSPQPATPLAPRLAARDGLSPARRRRQAAVKSPARGADKCAGKRWRPRPRLITTAATTTAPLFDNNDDMADAAYAIADERARDARRAGLQAKKDEQPANTARSYRSKQEEWKARPRPPPLFREDVPANEGLCRPGAGRRAPPLTARATASQTASSSRRTSSRRGSRRTSSSGARRLAGREPAPGRGGSRPSRRTL